MRPQTRSLTVISVTAQRSNTERDMRLEANIHMRPQTRSLTVISVTAQRSNTERDMRLEANIHMRPQTRSLTVISVTKSNQHVTRVTVLCFYYRTLEQKSSLQSLGYICSNSQKYIACVNIIEFSFMPKIIRILRSCSMKIFCNYPTVNISKLNYWLIICIAEN